MLRRMSPVCALYIASAITNIYNDSFDLHTRDLTTTLFLLFAIRSILIGSYMMSQYRVIVNRVYDQGIYRLDRETIVLFYQRLDKTLL